MDLDHVIAVVPHYIAMLLIIAGALSVINALVGDLGFWIELAVVIVIASLYRPIVLRLGIAPEPWR